MHRVNSPQRRQRSSSLTARRMVRVTRKRVGILAAVASLYVGFVICGQTYIISTTENMAKSILTDDEANAHNIVHVAPLDSRLLVSRVNTSDMTTEKSTASHAHTQGDFGKSTEFVQEKPPVKTLNAEEEFILRMADVQKNRHELVRKRCRDTYNITQQVDFKRDRDKILSWKNLYEHAYANDDFKFIICRVLKVGSFSWRRVIRSLHTKGSAAFRKKQKMGDFPMQDYDNNTFLTELQNYTKILFVREPFARLLSGYRDKYVELRHFAYYKPIGSKIIKEFRKGATKKEIASGKPSFEEFVRWLVKNPDNRGGDYHWRPLFDWYHPCEVQYDYIGKLETASEDAKYIFKMIGIDKLESYPSTETHHQFSSAKDILKQFYSKLSPELLPQIVHRYREEFVLFNYSVPQTMSDIWA